MKESNDKYDTRARCKWWKIATKCAFEQYNTVENVYRFEKKHCTVSPCYVQQMWTQKNWVEINKFQVKLVSVSVEKSVRRIFEP